MAFTLALCVTGASVAPALAAPKGKPGVTPPGVPPGQPFQALQKQIDALAGRVKALESAAPDAGLLWIDALALRLAGTSSSIASADLVGAGAQQGLVVTAAGASVDLVQAGVQVPPGFAVTGVKVCFSPGAAGSRVSGAQLFQFAVPPLVPPATALNEAFAAPTSSSPTCVESTGAVSVDPSAGGPLYVSLGLAFSAAESVVIRGVGLHLQPVTAP